MGNHQSRVGVLLSLRILGVFPVPRKRLSLYDLLNRCLRQQPKQQICQPFCNERSPICPRIQIRLGVCV